MYKSPQSNRKLLIAYSGLAIQLIAILGCTVYAGNYMDKWIKSNSPLFIWILPLLFIAGMMIKVIKDTSKKQ
jgi:hypothetical protein